MDSSLKEKPAGAFQIFGPGPATRKPVLRLGENVGAGLLRPLIMLVDVIDVDQHAVDDPRDVRPDTGALAMLAMALRALVVGTERRQHDHPVTRIHLGVTEPAVS